MAQPQRRPVGTGYREEFDLLEAGISGLDVSARLEAAWSGRGGGRGGRELDDLLSGLGEAYIEDGVVKWDPPAGLDPTFVEYLSRSVEELNRLLKAGTVTLDEDGDIRPAAASGQRRQPSQASRQWRR